MSDPLLLSAPEEADLQLHMRFENETYPTADSSLFGKPTVFNRVTLGKGATDHAGLNSRAARFVYPDSQLKVPTPISLDKGVYTVMGWVKLPLAESPSGWRTFTSGFAGDHQVIVDELGRLGVVLTDASSSGGSASSATPCAE